MRSVPRGGGRQKRPADCLADYEKYHADANTCTGTVQTRVPRRYKRTDQDGTKTGGGLMADADDISGPPPCSGPRGSGSLHHNGADMETYNTVAMNRFA